MTNKELWIQIRRLILSAVAILDKYYQVPSKMPALEIIIREGDDIATAVK